MATRGRTGSRRRASVEDVEPEVSATPRSGAKRTVTYYVRQLPRYLKLLSGLATDPRVPMLDKMLVLGAIAYIVMPVDIIPDFIPFLGDLAELYLLILALQRLIASAGRTVLLDNRTGKPDELADMNIRRAIAAAAL